MYKKHYKLLFVPHYVRTAIWRAGHKTKDLRHYDIVKHILSRDEIGILHNLNKELEYHKLILLDTMNGLHVNLFDMWKLPQRRDEDADRLFRYCEDNKFNDEIMSRLFGAADHHQVDDYPDFEFIEDFGLFVYVKSGYFGTENNELYLRNRIAMTKSVVLNLAQYSSLHDVIHTHACKKLLLKLAL